MAQITTKSITTAGSAPAFRAAASGDTAECGAGVVLELRNTDAASRAIGIVVPGNVSYGPPNPDPSYTLIAPAGELRIPMLDIYKDPSDGLAHITYTATANVTVAVTKIA